MEVIQVILYIIIVIAIILLFYASIYNKIKTHILKINSVESEIDESLRLKYDLLIKSISEIKQIDKDNDKFKDVEKIKEGLENIIVPGRNELVPNKEELPIMLDYAHTAESLENILQATKTYTPGRVICVFGCGGDRDIQKRCRGDRIRKEGLGRLS